MKNDLRYTLCHREATDHRGSTLMMKPKRTAVSGLAIIKHNSGYEWLKA